MHNQPCVYQFHFEVARYEKGQRSPFYQTFALAYEAEEHAVHLSNTYKLPVTHIKWNEQVAGKPDGIVLEEICILNPYNNGKRVYSRHKTPA